VSTADQVETGYSLDAQRQRIAAFCQAKGWELVNVYADEGVSAVKHRPQFEQMVSDVLADGVGHVVALKLDRLGRRASELLTLYDRLERKGVGLAFVVEGIDTSTPTGRLMRTMLAAFAEFERDLISERTKIGMAEAKAQGVRFGRKSELPDEVKARIRKLNAEGVSLNGIAKLLTDEGVPTGQGGQRWYASSVKVVLRPGT
jgi:DNA invertase Pin-like site-specific DNA recombinase